MAPNFLLLDEPTNDLDLDTIRLLEDYLGDFAGCILLVSHDRALLDRLTDSLLVFDGAGGVRSFIGNYEDYRQERAGVEADRRKAAAAARGRDGASASPVATAPGAPRARLSFEEKKEYTAILAEIGALEKEQKALEDSFQRPTEDPEARVARARRYREVRRTIEERMARWEELAGRAEGGR